jgi:hypothetical protein
MEKDMRTKIEYIVEKRSDDIVEFIMYLYKRYPDEVDKMFKHTKIDEHITNKRDYEKAVQHFKWANGRGQGEKWKPEELNRIARIDFKDVDYTEYDFAYMVNKLYSKCCKDYPEMSYYIKMVKNIFDNKDENENENETYQGDFFKTENKQKQGNLYLAYDSENRRYYNEYDRYENNRYEKYDGNYNGDYENSKYKYNPRYDGQYENHNPYEDRRY